MTPPAVEPVRPTAAAPLVRRAGTAAFGLVCAAALFALSLVLMGALLRPHTTNSTRRHDPAAIEAARRARDLSFDPHDLSQLPRIQRDVSYEQLQTASYAPRGEAPVLAPLVERGVFPRVAERVGPEPLVLDGGEIGRYGGTWLRAASSDFDVFMVEFRIGYSGLFRWSPLGYPIVPHLATRIESSPDGREHIVHLRHGVKWSDGHPYTADDLLFWWRYEDLDRDVGDGVADRWLMVGGGTTEVIKLDDHRVLFRFEHPYGNFLEALASYSLAMSAAPAHYLRKYHPKTADPAFLRAEMQALGAPTARALFATIKKFSNPECPRLWPWVPRTHSASSPYVYVRNPYYFAVDLKGNQLPYIDRVQFDVKSSQMLALSIASGEVSMQGRHLKYENYTELMERQKQVGYQVRHWYSATRSAWTIHPNLNRLVQPGDAETSQKAQLLYDKRFRQALSLAIDRKTIIDAEYNGLLHASQVEPGKESPFHHRRLAEAFVKYDPARANQLLDELGLTRRDVDGMRTLPDGSVMTFNLNFTSFTGIGPGQFVVDDWREVGVRVVAREQSRSLFYIKRDSSDFDFLVWPSESDYFPMLEPRMFVAPNTEALYATRWGRWFAQGGFYFPDRALKVAGPPHDHPMYRAYVAYTEALQLPTQQAQVQRFKEALDIAAENVWSISIADAPPYLVVVNSDLHNVPQKAMYADVTRTPANTGTETYFFAHPLRNAEAETTAALAKPDKLPRYGQAQPSSDRSNEHPLSVVLRSLFMLTALGLAVLLAVRHPFVLRRIAVLVPTLLVISVVVFTIIQLPPGDFLSARISALEETGDAGAIAEIESLKESFHSNEPGWKQYLRWMGGYWFFTFKDEDTGLLQGDLGNSMETNRPVSEMLGDRVLLTVLISALSLLLTWLLAIPIGVYSAVRQYSWGDYAFTFIGFLGMSVPPFLFALILMVISGISGLFSPEFAAQASWSVAKVLDLLSHIWVPLIVMGVTGTAGMIRVMRANLLDELGKPYVTTARARGVRPLKLLFKYPVRIALNPFVSTMGTIFPQLVSGSAIVSIVLSLPTVGPLQVNALFNEDMYLAGSMLMLLSLLAVLGTLVADLLLLWLDPRIRYEHLGES